jgi:hypothetical protein
MKILLAFAPFIVFVIVERLVGYTGGLAAAALTSAMLIIREYVAKRTPKILEVGTLILFAALAIYAAVRHPAWSVIAVRLMVDAGLLLVVVASLALRKPFTLQYAKEQVAPELWDSPDFQKINYVITGVWALAFDIMVAAEAAILFLPYVPQKVGVWIAIIAIYGAYRFTVYYPKRNRTSSNL